MVGLCRRKKVSAIVFYTYPFATTSLAHLLVKRGKNDEAHAILGEIYS